MKKITLALSLMLCSFFVTGQVLNQNANWPNTNWDLSGTYDPAPLIFTGNPTVPGGAISFSFDDDEGGGSSDNNIGVQSPTINLTNAFNAGETILVVSSSYILNVYLNETLNLQYWDANTNTWVNWGPTYDTSTSSAPNVDYCNGTPNDFQSEELDFSGFSSNQLQNFRYRIYYDDNDSYGYGICFNSPNLSSAAPPNCPEITDLSICNVTDNSADIYWSPGSNEITWQIAVQPQGSGAPSSGTSTNTNDAYMISGLSANTNYEVYVRSQCLDGSGFNSWASLPFATNNTPPAPNAFVFTKNNSVSPMSASSYAVVDMNNDGLDDLIAANASSLQIIYQSTDGCFDETLYVTSANYGPGWSIAAGDLDGNGYNDLLYGAGNGVSFMMANADGTNYTQSFNTTDYVFSQRSNFIDINNDGNLDAFVCHDVEPNVYFINDGTGNLSYYQGPSSGVPNGIGTHPDGGNYGTVWVDYDNDGDSDMFIAKCRGGNVTHKINELWRNDGNGVFTNVAADPGVNLADPVQTWSSAWADYDNDGDMDAYIGASSSSDGAHKYMLNDGDGTFTYATAPSGAPYGIENAPADFNNDGYVDILSNGRILLNNGNNTFTVLNTGMPPSGAIGDLNNDGFLDVFTRTNNAGALYINNPNDNNWIKIRTQGTISNYNGIGARVEIVTALGTQIRDVRSGEGFEFMSSLNTHFGIGTDTEITSLTIKWPSGTVDVIFNPNINETITVIEGDNPLSINNNVLEEDLVIYPIPAKDMVTISSSIALNNAVYTIYDITGKQVLNANLNSNSINVSQLSTGIYVLKITVDGKHKTQKLIKE